MCVSMDNEYQKQAIGHVCYIAGSTPIYEALDRFLGVLDDRSLYGDEEDHACRACSNMLNRNYLIILLQLAIF